MAKTLFRQHMKQRLGFEWRDKDQFCPGLQTGNGRHDFGKRFASSANIFAHIQGNRSVAHQGGTIQAACRASLRSRRLGADGFSNGLVNVSSMENGRVAFTACRRFGGM